MTADEIPAGVAWQASEVYRDASAPGVPRSHDDIARFFSGLDMVAPGLVDAAAWRTPHLAEQPRPALFYAGIGRKPLPHRKPQVVASDCMLPPAVAGS